MIGANFEKKTYSQVFMKELTDALEENLISKQEDFEKYISNRKDISNFYVMLLSVVAEAISDWYEELDSEYYSNKVEYAVGKDLDDLGILINCDRPSGTRSAVNLKFMLTRSAEEDITIPKGIIVSSQNGLSFKTQEEIFIAEGNNEAIVTALCTQKGSRKQAPADSINNIVSDLSDYLPSSTIINVTNDNSTFGGSDPFTDAEYRSLLMNWIKLNQAGNLVSYTNYLSRVDGLESYNLIPKWDGAGTVKVVLDCDDSAEIMNKVWEDLNNKVTNIESDIYITTPSKIAIDVFTTIDVNIDRINQYSKTEMEDIKAKIQTAIITYINGGIRVNGDYYKGLTIGQDFIPFQLSKFITEEVQQVQNVAFQFPEEVIEITNEEIGIVGEIEINMQ